MEVLLICTKGEFDDERIKKVEKFAPVTWVGSDHTDILAVKKLFDKQEKILALSPVPINWKIPKALYKKLRSVKYVCLPTTGHEFIDVEECRRLGISVTNITHYSTNAVAEYAFFLLAALLKKLPAQMKNNFRYEFSDEVLADELRGKMVGIIGLGNIGKRIAEISSGLGAKVFYWSKKSRDKRFGYLELDNLIKRSDVLFPAVGVNSETVGMLDRKLLSSLKPSAYLVDITHGADEKMSIMDNDYLLERVESGKLGGYGFESDKAKIVDYKGNVFVTAPFAWYSRESLENNIEIWAETIISCIIDRPKNLVN